MAELQTLCLFAFLVCFTLTEVAEWTHLAGTKTFVTNGGPNALLNPIRSCTDSNWHPGGKRDAALFVGSRYIWMLGGYGRVSSFGWTEDIWRFDRDTNLYCYFGGSQTVNDGPWNSRDYFDSSNRLGGVGGSIIWPSNDTDSPDFFYSVFGSHFDGSKHTIVNVYSFALDWWKRVKASTQEGAWTDFRQWSFDAHPDGRRYFSHVFADDIMYLFGGDGQIGRLGDLWALKWTLGDSYQWQWIAGNSTVGIPPSYVAPFHPGARTLTTIYEYRSHVYVFGGVTASGQMSDMWSYDLSTNLWTFRAGPQGADNSRQSVDFVPGSYDSSNMPGSRDEFCGWRVGGELLIWGGDGITHLGGSSGRMNELWAYSVELDNWKFVSGEYAVANPPAEFDPPNYAIPGLVYQACGIHRVQNPDLGQVEHKGFVYAGYGYGSNAFMTDIWEFNYLSFRCEGYLPDDPRVCNYHAGVCVAEDECLCDSEHDGEFCDIYFCYGIPFNNIEEPDPVCNAHGRCVELNKCACDTEVNWYGEECQEEIQGAKINEERTEIEVAYGILKTVVEEYEMDGSFLCDGLVEAAESGKFGTQPVCSFEQTSADVEDLLIYDMLKILLPSDSSLEPGDVLIFHPVTNSSQSVEVEIGTSQFQFFAFVVEFWEYFAIGGGALVAVLVMLFLVLGICCCCCCCCRRKGGHTGRLDLDEVLTPEEDEAVSKGMARLRVNQKLFVIESDDVKLVKLIANGVDASIYLGEWSGKEVVMKVFRTRDLLGSESMADFESEVSLCSSVHHPNILSFFGASLKPPRIGIIMEYCPKGDLEAFIMRLASGEERCSLQEKVDILEGVSSGMAYLHGRDILHRDLKPKNVLLTNDYVPKLMDFGLSRMASASSKKTVRVGTSVYMAPEVTKGGDYGPKVDVFSFAILAYELLHETASPYGTGDLISIEFRVANDENFRPKVSVGNATLANLLNQCWAANPIERMDFSQISRVLGKSFQGAPAVPSRRRASKNWDD